MGERRRRGREVKKGVIIGERDDEPKENQKSVCDSDDSGVEDEEQLSYFM